MTDELNPYVAPQTPGSRSESAAPEEGEEVAQDEVFDPGPWRDYDSLVITPWSKLPDHCVKCDEPANGFRVRQVARVRPWWLYLVLLLGPVFWLALAAAPRHKMVFRFGLCRRHRRYRAVLLSIGPIVMFSGVVALFVIPVIGDRDAVARGFMAMCFLFFVGLGLTAMLGGTLRTEKLHEHYARIDGAGEKFLERLPIWPGA